MSWLRQTIPRKRQLLVAAGRFLTIIVVALLVIPQFACHCADGNVKLFCVPGKCGRVCGHLASEKSTCCASRASCCSGKASNRSERSHGDGAEPSVSKIPCCKLVITTQPPSAGNSVIEMPSTTDAAFCFAELPLDMGCLEAKLWQHVPVESIHPPDDIIIRLLHITI